MTKKLGEGHYSVVHLGAYKKTGQQVAIKCIRKGRTPLNQFTNEVELMQEVATHPTALKVKDFFFDPKYYVLVMEFISGGDLYSNSSQVVGFSEERIAKLVLQIAEGVAFLHSKKIVHRDIKPENILFVDKELTTIKICDFGIAKKLPKKGYLDEKIGTEGYMAPEVEAGKQYNVSSDMYSLGLVIYFMICGYSAFEPENGVVDLDFPIENWSNISSSVKDLITNLLDKKPNKRPTALQVTKHSWVSQKTQIIGKKRKLSENDEKDPPVVSKKQKTVLAPIQPQIKQSEGDTTPESPNNHKTEPSKENKKEPSETISSTKNKKACQNTTKPPVVEKKKEPYESLEKKQKAVPPPYKNTTNTDVSPVLAKKQKAAPPRCRPPIKQSYSAFFSQIGLDGVNLNF
uniref:Protein kinase domain-containing protein n=1 Tax=Arcella intermedia TaxID=1963864 RepID=A0A6B2L5Y9_9EUKA